MRLLPVSQVDQKSAAGASSTKGQKSNGDSPSGNKAPDKRTTQSCNWLTCLLCNRSVNDLHFHQMDSATISVKNLETKALNRDLLISLWQVAEGIGH